MVGRILTVWLLALTPAFCVDEASMMQAVKLKSHNQGALTSKPSRRAYLDDLLERTETVLKSGVTPDVVTFAQAAMDNIQNTIIPIISEEHTTDQNMLHSLWTGFVTAETDFLDGLAKIAELVRAHEAASGAHTVCRADESDLCADANACDVELGELWKTVVDLEEQIADVDEEIFTDYCENNENRTKSDFRTKQVTSFEEYNRLVPLLEEAWLAYQTKLSECRRKRKLHHDKIEVCIGGQTNLESATCATAVKTDSVREAYLAAFDQAEVSYQTAVEGIKVEEADRKVEFSTLQMILCLLDNINEMVNGSAAAAGTDYVTHLEACREEIFDTAHLDMDYNETPAKLGLPDIPHYPCTAEYELQEYGDMPFCTEAEVCVRCAGMP